MMEESKKNPFGINLKRDKRIPLWSAVSLWRTDVITCTTAS